MNINGQEYFKYGTSYRLKREAQREARQRRKEGWNVRIIKTKNGYQLYQKKKWWV